MKKFLIYYIIFTIVYIVLIATTSMFLMTWGAKRGFWEQLYVWFLTKPFSLEISGWLFLLNSFCWYFFLFILTSGIKKLPFIFK